MKIFPKAIKGEMWVAILTEDENNDKYLEDEVEDSESKK